MNSGPSKNDGRIDLEERFLFVERDLEELSGVVARQALLLERLEGELRELRSNAAPSSSESGSSRTLEDDRPPHY